jgi:hypothetical protein
VVLPDWPSLYDSAQNSCTSNKNVIKAVVAMTFLARDGLHKMAAFIGAQTAIARSTDISARKRPDVIPPEYAMKYVNLH